MKSILFTLFLSFQVFDSSASEIVPVIEIHSLTLQNIEDGWYEANVTYNNPNTYQRSNYQLSVKVENNRVNTIDFGNEGSIHAGYNNSGYTYYGGNLSFQRDFNGQISSASTQVSVTDSNGTRYYDVKIQ